MPRPVPAVVPAGPAPVRGPLGPSELHERIAPVLRGLAFPAHRWQIVTEGDLYGCDGVTRELLARVPEHRYQSLPELVGALAAVVAGRTPDRPGPVRLPPHRRRSGPPSPTPPAGEPVDAPARPAPVRPAPVPPAVPPRRPVA